MAETESWQKDFGFKVGRTADSESSPRLSKGQIQQPSGDNSEEDGRGTGGCEVGRCSVNHRHRSEN
jgi:hypothetical protein